eukprot:COSAG06_NODE_1070_length_10820_cov_4.675494_8_plen_81_part_00
MWRAITFSMKKFQITKRFRVDSKPCFFVPFLEGQRPLPSPSPPTSSPSAAIWLAAARTGPAAVLCAPRARDILFDNHDSS